MGYFSLFYYYSRHIVANIIIPLACCQIFSTEKSQRYVYDCRPLALLKRWRLAFRRSAWTFHLKVSRQASEQYFCRVPILLSGTKVVGQARHWIGSNSVRFFSLCTRFRQVELQYRFGLLCFLLGCATSFPQLRQ